MSGLIYLLLFVFGTALGSFINVLAFRYSVKNGFKLSLKGRSRCRNCSKTLGWFELLPVFSFLIQRGKCRQCSKKLSWQYPIVEILAGLVLVFVPMKLGFTFPALVWILVFLVFILISLIDLRLKIIPDKLTAIILFLGVTLLAFYYFTGVLGLDSFSTSGSFLRNYALIFWLAKGSIFINIVLGTFIGGILFWAINILSRGKAMGFGDVKLAFAIGFLLRWPDAILAFALSFIVGAIVGIALLLTKKKEMKSAIPFGPFIVLGVTLVFFFGYDIVNGYFKLFNIF